MMEYVIWGIHKDKPADPINEIVLCGNAKSKTDIDRIINIASKDGFHHIRVSALDIDILPDFISAINNLTERIKGG